MFIDKFTDVPGKFINYSPASKRCYPPLTSEQTIRKTASMKIEMPLLNLQIAWAWMVLGFLSNDSGNQFPSGRLARRLWELPAPPVSLGHISFFGLGTVNLMFYLTVENLAHRVGIAPWPGWAFILGAVTMPICCFATAHQPRLRTLFAVPVISLLGGGLMVLWQVLSLKSPL